MSISKLGIKRLYKLVEFMESLPASANKHFNMGFFFDHKGDDGHEHELPAKPTVKDLHACGTTACALGWAMTVPSFRRAGLFMVQTAWGYTVEGSEKVFDLHEEEDEEYFWRDNWDEVFGEGNNDKTPKAWAKRIRKFLKEREARNVRKA